MADFDVLIAGAGPAGAATAISLADFAPELRVCIADLPAADGLRVGETVPEKLALALDLEREAINRLNAGIATCVGAGDHGTRELLDHILEGEEDHADWIETQLELISQIGEAHYLSQQIRS